MQGIYKMRKPSKFSLLFVLLFSAVVAVSAQESDQDWKKEPSQEAPEQAKKEAQKPDTKASAGDLARAVHEDRDRFFMAMLKPLGIEKGKPFQPNQWQKKILIESALVGETMAKANSFDKRFEGMRYRSDAHWDYVVAPWYAVDQDVDSSTQFEERTGLFYEAIGMSAGSIPKTPGVGQAYFSAYRDKDGHAFNGGKTYRLHVPPNAPVKQFWSVTLYDIVTRCLIQNKEQIADRSSRQDLLKNADGSVDLYFSPSAPKGFEKNWIPTVPRRAWFTYFRLYGPLEAYSDKTWPLPDIERVP
jgi:hypothetical protein